MIITSEKVKEMFSDATKDGNCLVLYKTEIGELRVFATDLTTAKEYKASASTGLSALLYVDIIALLRTKK